MSADIINLAERRPNYRAIRSADPTEQLVALAALRHLGLTLDHISAANWQAAHESAVEATELIGSFAGIK